MYKMELRAECDMQNVTQLTAVSGVYHFFGGT